MNIWDFWAKRYNRLWVQKYSLGPTRQYILSLYDEIINKEDKILDLGCGPGQLIQELLEINSDLNITGLDFSKAMLDISRERNPKAKHIMLDVANLDKINDKFNIIISTHSLPYYKDPKEVFMDLHSILEDDGRVIIAFASGDSLYDKFILSLVKITTGRANYPSDKGFRDLTAPYFQVEDIKIVREKFFMPRIPVYRLKKVEK